MPDKLSEMKAKFLEVWEGVEKEGPSQWWANQPNGGRRSKGPILKNGKDNTGDFDVVKGGTVSKTEFGYLLDTGDSEGFAVQKLDRPVQESATFKLKYRSAVDTTTRNACFCFGALAQNDRLHKAGTLIGMERHGAFDGSWANVGIGASKTDDFQNDATFEAEVTIDLDHTKLILKVNGKRIEHQLPGNLEKVDYVGIYAKKTKSEFSEITRVK